MQWVSLLSWDFGQSASVMVDQKRGRVGGDQQVVADRQIVEQLERLERAHQPGARPLMGRGIGDVVTVERDGSPVGRGEAGERVDAGGLARAVRPDEAHDLTRLHLHADTVERHQPAVLDGELAHLEHDAGALAFVGGGHAGATLRRRLTATDRTTPVMPSGAVMAVTMRAMPLMANTYVLASPPVTPFTKAV